LKQKSGNFSQTGYKRLTTSVSLDYDVSKKLFFKTDVGFTNEKANDLKNGLKYNSEASTFGFQIAKNFLQEIFS